MRMEVKRSGSGDEDGRHDLDGDNKGHNDEHGAKIISFTLSIFPRPIGLILRISIMVVNFTCSF